MKIFITNTSIILTWVSKKVRKCKKNFNMNTQYCYSLYYLPILILVQTCIFKKFLHEIKVLLLLLTHAGFCFIWLNSCMLNKTNFDAWKSCFSTKNKIKTTKCYDWCFPVDFMLKHMIFMHQSLFLTSAWQNISVLILKHFSTKVDNFDGLFETFLQYFATLLHN